MLTHQAPALGNEGTIDAALVEGFEQWDPESFMLTHA